MRTLVSTPAGVAAVWLETGGHVTWRRVAQVWLNSLGTRDFRNRLSDPHAQIGKVYKKIAQLGMCSL